MTHPISEAQLVELALAASNFDERSQILGFAKRDAEDAEDCAVPVSAVERWRIDKMTAKLSAAYFAALQDDGTPVAALTDRVGQVLERFQRARPAIVRCPRARADLLALHAEWVPTYREALALVNPLDAAAATTLAEAGQPLSKSALVIDGMMCRYIDDRDGLRQLVGLYLPGDFIDLPSYSLSYLEHNIASLTQAKVAVIPHERIALMVAKPEL
ncbi:MAG: Crp/Fnr family transcriptional regulator, partial [Oxalobacteraceae bacterium]